ncbi:MAG: hypothetical protein QNK23_17160 [Crocinitomicaceae bacterium]|nr:hypothetical protein [Crocinitomicaceae bacterium]
MAVKQTAGLAKKILLTIILFGPAFILALIGLQRCEHVFTELDDYGPAPNYSFTSSEGVEMTQDDFDGNIVLMTVLQPLCPDSCSLSFWHVDQDLYQRIRKNKKKLGAVRMISYVVDYEGNPIEDVSAIRDMMYDQVQHYDPNIWYIASGDYKEVYNLENNPELEEEVNGYFGEEDRWKLMLLIDREQHFRIGIEGNTEGLIRKMKHYIALLQKEYDKTAADAEQN